MKFINLLKKELTELLNKQMFLGLAVTVLLFMFIGNFMSETIEETSKTTFSVNICDNDNTEITAEILDMIQGDDNDVKICTYNEGEEYSECLKANDVDCLLIIPKGFSDSVKKGEPASLISISKMQSASTLSNISNTNSSAISAVNGALTLILAKENGISEQQLMSINSPITVSEQTVVADKSAAVSVNDIMNKLMMQNMILPLIVFFLIIMTSQMLVTAIANEKIDKTLETLLSAPVSRTSIIGAKMLSAAIVALINAVVYMLAFSFFVGDASGSLENSIPSETVSNMLSADEAMDQLGLTLGITDYILIGIQLFLTILICLSVSLILGALVDDPKSTQTIIMPILMLAVVPYFISMLADINSLPSVLRILVYAIPFTHTFSAVPNLTFGHTTIFYIGIGYQLVVFIICMFFALRIFKSDKILTLSLNLGQKSKFKKGRKNNTDD